MMTFGKLEDLSLVDFSLPVDNPLTGKVLNRQIDMPKPDIYVGPPVWSDKSWPGKIYPQGTKEKDYLYHFSRQFNTIELNATHYKIPTVADIVRWKEVSADGFKFCPKFHKEISHERQLIGTEAKTMEFCETILKLEKKLGRAFLQLSPSYQPTQLRNLERYLKSLPKAMPVSVELRHEKWFSDQAVWQEACAMLQSVGAGVVISDVAGRRDALHMTLVDNNLMLRFVGNDLHETDYPRVDEWCHKVAEWIANGLQTAYIFVHSNDNKFAPELCLYWIKKLNEFTGLQLPEPRISPQVVQGNLF